MRMLLVTKEEDLEPCELFPGIFIRQPKKPDELKDVLELGHMLDLLLVPGVAFDGEGARLGRGKGYDEWPTQHTGTPTDRFAHHTCMPTS